MKNFFNLTDNELLIEYQKLLENYNEYKSLNLNLNMSRGKPCSEQLDLSTGLLNVLSTKEDCINKDGIDCRNYGINDGLPEMKEFISELTGIDKENFIVGGNSSLSMMFDTISYFITHGSSGSIPWGKGGKIKFLCPSPGYDRHFAISEFFGMEMIEIPMKKDGPDMDLIEKHVSEDSSVKGIWCVPKYSNPQGITYSDEVVKRFAKLKPAAKDFKIIWDNAYFVHDLTDEETPLLNIIDECKKYGNEELPIVFYSTSKITFPGAGVAFMACLGQNLKDFKKMYSIKTVGFDKLNQLRHIKFLKNKATLLNYMKKHREILNIKFKIVIDCLNKEFKDNPILRWNNPKGGYFVSVDTDLKCAKRVVELCKELGVVLTGAGATYPYKKDRNDTNIRLAPTFLSENELKTAIKLFCLCVKLAFIEKRIKNQNKKEV
ncbi:MAG: aminotransferase [Clostridia bacterium]|nr:aminotransferase [Clostridia bacterium]